jgi:hypothetical protein
MTEGSDIDLALIGKDLNLSILARIDLLLDELIKTRIILRAPLLFKIR